MPRNPRHRDIGSLEHLALSDQDVELLHQIITRAETHRDVGRLPFRAIFAEYDAVLAEYGIDSGKDQKYLPFLFQIGDKTLRNHDLYTRFEILLAHLNIRLDYGDDTEAFSLLEPDAIRHYHNEDDIENSLSRKNGAPRGRQQQRRASFNSMYDVTLDLSQKIKHRPSSRSSVSRLDIGASALDASIQSSEHAHSQDHYGRHVNGFVDTNANNWDSTNGVGRSHDDRDPPALLGAGGRYHEIDAAASSHFEEEQQESESSSSGDSNEAIVKPANAFPLLYQPSISDLLRDSSVFNMYRQRKAIKPILEQWLQKCIQQRETLGSMDKIAVNNDAKTLLRQALDIWRSALQQKRQVAQTERFFKHLEERAARARDLYLLTKAFTHWSQVTSEELKKSSAAREHVLCIKYFNAWREITAVNELKAQRFVIKRHFNLCNARYQNIAENEASASQFYQKKLATRTLGRLFFEFCDRRAPRWNEVRLKQRSLISWLRALRTQRELDLEMDSEQKRTQLQWAFQALLQRHHVVSGALGQAKRTWKTNVTSKYFTQWHIYWKCKDPYAKASSMVNTRLVRSLFDTWILRTRMERRARDVDRHRVMRNAWTVWNDRLRCQALASKTDERLVMQALYKWILMERLSLVNRIRQQRLKSKTLNNLVKNSEGLYTTLLYKEEEFRIDGNRKSMRSIFSYWRDQLGTQVQRERGARAFYAPRVQQDSFDCLKRRWQHSKLLEGWAKDARYFFLAKKSLNYWRNATKDQSKSRRLEAYSRIRRKIKMNLASNVLSTWHSRTVTIRDSDHEALEVYGSKLIREGTNLFHQWHEKTTQRSKNLEDAQIYFNRQLVYNHLTHWVAVQRKFQSYEEKATSFFEIHVSGVAIAQMRKLSLRLFEIESRLDNAGALYERNTRKHFRNMLHHWRKKARQTQELNFPTALATPANSHDFQPFDGIDDAQGLGITPDGKYEPIRQPNFTSHTPISTPGYLSSPSKRASRAVALFQASTTPATPLPTSFPSRLWASSETRMLKSAYSSRKGGHKRNSMSANVRFAIEEEPESPTEGRPSHWIG
ncbi:hypothetical protein FQN57_007087 [Myotisia sp. PD_48]|nr:hypothetical protein FQN57_007087 [Myotisia sp. PD_48]